MRAVPANLGSSSYDLVTPSDADLECEWEWERLAEGRALNYNWNNYHHDDDRPHQT